MDPSVCGRVDEPQRGRQRQPRMRGQQNLREQKRKRSGEPQCRQRRRAKAMSPKLPSRFIAEMGLDVEGGAGVLVSVDSAKARLASLKGLLKPRGPSGAGPE